MKILLILVALTWFTSNVSPVHTEDIVVFCDVGQGDASYIQSDDMDILIDAGPDAKVLPCLSRYMDRFDHTIELIILSHADRDHFGGLLDVIKKYKVRSVILPLLDNPDKDYQRVVNHFKTSGTRIIHIQGEDRVSFPHSNISFIYPTSKDIPDCLPNDRNQCSYIFYFDLRGVSILFTGDTSADSYTSLYAQKLRTVDVMKIPHHGSKNGLTERLIEVTDPLLNVASLGEDNQYGHPHQEVVTMLGQRKFLRTDIHGNVVLKLSY
jgi:competence protein ComEC